MKGHRVGGNPLQLSATLADLGDGFALGDVAEQGEQAFLLVQAAAAIPQGAACALTGPNSAQPLTQAHAVAEHRIVIPQTAGDIASGHYFWGMTRGDGMVLVAGNTAAGVGLYVNDTAGRLTSAVGLMGLPVPVYLLEARGTGAGLARCRIPRVL